jgi:hypothetical protein
VVVDDRDLAAAGGGLGTAGLPASAAVTRGEILRGDRPARENTGRPAGCAPAGLPWQDLALTWLVYRAAAGSGRFPPPACSAETRLTAGAHAWPLM